MDHVEKDRVVKRAPVLKAMQARHSRIPVFSSSWLEWWRDHRSVQSPLYVEEILCTELRHIPNITGVCE